MQNLARNQDRIDALTAAFAAAEYVVDAKDESVVIRIGETTPALDRLLDGRPWAVITAHNPDGRRCPDATNAAAQKALEQSLQGLRPAVLLAATNRDPDRRWPDEPAWLFTPDSISRADRLAHRFGQRAIVAGLPEGPATLRVYGDPHAASGKTPAVVS